MDGRTVLFALHEIPGIGWQTIRKLAAKFPQLSVLSGVDADELAQCGISGEKAAKIRQFLQSAEWERRLELYERREIRFLTVLDPDYPALLKETHQPPWVLYYKGRLECLQRPLLAMVGTRHPTAYGKRVAGELAAGLSACGVGIVSGLARGIDSEAHRGALSGEGKTVAVLGTGLERIYPPENRELFHRIAAEGLIITEYPLGTPSHPGLFPQRNRIIAGLTLGTIVIEAAEKSGSLITADLALAESRDVFAVPGPITSPKSRGTLSLIKQGAKMVTDLEDILEEYRHMLSVKQLLPKEEKGDGEEEPLTGEECFVYDILSRSPEPLSIDELMERTNFGFGQLHSVLLSLLMKRKIEQLPGSTYTTATYAGP